MEGEEEKRQARKENTMHEDLPWDVCVDMHVEGIGKNVEFDLHELTCR